MKGIDVFEYEVIQITDEGLVKLIRKVFEELTPDYFWTCPASTSGKYHPRYAIGVGGLVRHTKMAYLMAVDILTALQVDNPDRNIVLTAVLLHDTYKNGRAMTEAGYAVDGKEHDRHGILQAKRIEESCKDISPHTEMVCRAICCHMGQWTPDGSWQRYRKMDSRTARIVELVHLADYIASRKIEERIRFVRDILADPEELLLRCLMSVKDILNNDIDENKRRVILGKIHNTLEALKPRF